MMIDKKGVDDADILSPEAFYKEAHKHIFWSDSAVVYWNTAYWFTYRISTIKENAKLDLAEVILFNSATQKISSSAHIEFHLNYSTKNSYNEVWFISSEIIEESYDETTDVLIYW
jgi:replicative DNA helicase